MKLVLAWLVLGLGVATADIRFDPKGPPLKTPPTEPPQPTSQKGCAREASPEWMFGLVVLGLGAVGLRRFGRGQRSAEA